MSNELKGELLGIRRKDSETVSVAFAGCILDVLDESITWQLFYDLPSNDQELRRIINKGGVQVVGNKTTNISFRTITLNGKREDVCQTLKAIGYTF